MTKAGSNCCKPAFTLTLQTTEKQKSKTARGDHEPTISTDAAVLSQWHFCVKEEQRTARKAFLVLLQTVWQVNSGTSRNCCTPLAPMRILELLITGWKSDWSTCNASNTSLDKLLLMCFPFHLCEMIPPDWVSVARGVCPLVTRNWIAKLEKKKRQSTLKN